MSLTRRELRVAASGAAAVLVVALSPAVASSASAATAASTQPAVTFSVAVLDGTVPQSGATPVVARVWPVGADTVGQRESPLAQIASVTNSTGTAAFRLPMTASLVAAAAANDGVLNIDVTATTGQGTGSVGLARPVTTNALRGSGLQLLPAVEAGATATRQVAARYANAKPARLELVSTPSVSAPQAVPDVDHCTRILASSASSVTTFMSQLHTDSSVTGTYQYGASADSDIDIGGSQNGTTGWSIVGSFHVGNTQGQSASATISGITARNMFGGFNYQKWLYDPVCGGARYRSNATAWTGGVALGASVTVGNFCTGPPSTFSGGGTYHKYTGTNVKVSAGVSVFGGTLGAQSGWSTSSDLFYSFGSVGDRNHYELCSHSAGVTLNNASTVYADTIFG